MEIDLETSRNCIDLIEEERGRGEGVKSNEDIEEKIPH